jgi:hypothetical protein
MDNFRKPDLNKPRYREPRKNIHDNDFFKALIEKYPKFKSYKKKELIDIIRKFNREKVIDTIINTRAGVDLSQGIGCLFIGSCKITKADNIDFGKSIKYGQKILHKNWVTDGEVGKIFYTNVKAKYKIEDNGLWMFKPERLFKRLVAEKFPEMWKTYVQIDGRQYVSSFHKQKSRPNIPISETYNEFE